MADGISITDLEQKTEVTDNDNFAVDNGAVTNKVTAKQIKDYMAPTYVKKSGDTMTGPLKLPAPAADLNDNTAITAAWARKYGVNKAGDTMTGPLKVQSPALSSNDTTVPNTSWVRQYGVNKAGDTMTGPLKLPAPAAGLNDNTAITAAWARALITGKTVVKDYIVDRYSDDSGNWYEVYASGWVEQGGIFSHTSANPATISLLKAFANTNYTIVTTSIRDGSAGSSARNNVGATGKTTTSFKVYGSHGAEGSAMWPIYWTAFGKGA